MTFKRKNEQQKVCQLIGPVQLQYVTTFGQKESAFPLRQVHICLVAMVKVHELDHELHPHPPHSLDLSCSGYFVSESNFDIRRWKLHNFDVTSMQNKTYKINVAWNSFKSCHSSNIVLKHIAYIEDYHLWNESEINSTVILI